MKQVIIICIIAAVGVAGFILLTQKPKDETLQMSYNTTTDTTTTPIPTPMSTTPTISSTPITGKPHVEFTTSKGKFVIEMNPSVAPKTVANYLDKWTTGYCEGLTFHRVEDWVVQGCDPLGNGTGGNSTLPTETSQESFTVGSVGVARKAFPKEISNDSQFFIVKTDATFLNGDYTWFGKVISGMDVVNKIAVGDKILKTSRVDK